MPEDNKYLTINQSDRKQSLLNVSLFAEFYKSKKKKKAELF